MIGDYLVVVAVAVVVVVVLNLLELVIHLYLFELMFLNCLQVFEVFESILKCFKGDSFKTGEILS